MSNVFATNANLLVALAALIEEKSVTEAAKRCGVTQSAMSGTLAQLRELLDDPLLVRVGRAMQPTPRALALLAPLQRGLAAFDEVLTPPKRFDPATSEQRFAIALDDRAEVVIVPHLLRRIRDAAPRVQLQVHPWGRHRAPPGLATGELDLAVGLFLDGPTTKATRRLKRKWPSMPDGLPPGHRHHPLFELEVATLVRADHPRVRRRLDLATFCALDHVLVTEEPWASGIVDDALARKGLRRRIAARVPRFLSVGWIVASTDLVATLDDRIATLHAQTHGLRVLETPIAVPPAPLGMLWHERAEHDPGHAWLREQVRGAAVRCGKVDALRARLKSGARSGVRA